MKEYAFDVKLWVTAHVLAKSVPEAKALLKDCVDSFHIETSHPSVQLGSPSHEGNFDLIEIAGEPVE